MGNVSTVHEIDVSKYVRTYVGKKTLMLIEQEIKECHERGIKNVVVNMDNMSMNNDYIKFVAGLIYNYECEFTGLGNKEPIIEAYLHTGYFVKEALGSGKYVQWFRKQVEVSDFPLMILDNRLASSRLVPMNVIQPIRFDEHYFHYKVIKPKYLEPEDLERAIVTNEAIFTNESINIVDIATESAGFRFASTDKERVMLDIFEAIISNKLVGFLRERE